jgi:hypothetical protein
MPTQIKHYPFARVTLMRQVIRHRTACGWCDRPARFRYAWVDDARDAAALRASEWGREVCGIGCHRAYYGDER